MLWTAALENVRIAGASKEFGQAMVDNPETTLAGAPESLRAEIERNKMDRDRWQTFVAMYDVKDPNKKR